MSTTFSYSTFAVINAGCPIDQTVLGTNVARLVLGTLPDAVELELDYESLRALTHACAVALQEMQTQPDGR